MTFSPRQRIPNAYLGEWSDCIPVAPEFWYYVPARVLGVDMVTFECNDIAEAFTCESRVIIGTGDQVGGDTPEENIHAMIETARRIAIRTQVGEGG